MLVRSVRTVSIFYGVKEDWEGSEYGGKFDFRCGELSKAALNVQNNEKEVRGGAGDGRRSSDAQVRVGFSQVRELANS